MVGPDFRDEVKVFFSLRIIYNSVIYVGSGRL